MEFVVFLLVYVVRRRLDQANRLVGDALWRSSFGHAHTVKAGHEDRLLRGLMTLLIPTILLASGETLLSQAGWSVLVHPLAVLLLLVLIFR